MIELSRNQEPAGGSVIKVVGVGGAGARAVDRLCREGVAGVDLLVANADARALAASLTPQKVALGRNLTRGLGAGGDPEVGRAAAAESGAELAGKLSGASLVIVVAGLGGGVGSGAAPEVAAIARNQGALVVVVATLPFQFEGKRRKDQALEALHALRRNTNLVVCFDNQRMSSIVGPAAGIEDAFEVVDALLAQVIRSLSALVRRRSILNSGLDEVAATVAGPRSTALFGFGVADGEARAEGALARALQSALLDKGHRLADADRLWIHVAGGEDMRWSEVQAIMTRASAQVSDHVRIFCGAAIDPALAGAISVTILAGVPDREFSTALADLDGEPGVGLATDYPPSEPGVLAYAGLHAEPAPSSQPQMETPLVDLASGHEQQVPMDPQFEIHAEEEPVPPEVFATESHVPFDAPPAPNPEWPADSGDDFAEVVHASFPADPAQDIRKENRVMEEGSPPVEAFANNRRSANPEPPKGVEQPGRLGGDASGSGAGAGSLENVRRENRQPSVGPEVHTEPPPPQPAQPAPATPNLTASPQGTQVVASPPAAPAESDPASKKKETVQEQMKFEPVNRGRFEKTDPTIVDGEDLDVPTFLRRRRDV